MQYGGDRKKYRSNAYNSGRGEFYNGYSEDDRDRYYKRQGRDQYDDYGSENSFDTQNLSFYGQDDQDYYQP